MITLCTTWSIDLYQTCGINPCKNLSCKGCQLFKLARSCCIILANQILASCLARICKLTCNLARLRDIIQLLASSCKNLQHFACSFCMGAYALVRGGSSTSNLLEPSRTTSEIPLHVVFFHMSLGWFKFPLIVYSTWSLI